MHDVIFIGDRRHAALFRAAGINSFVPAKGHLAERVIAERGRCRVLAITAKAFAALPPELARELREASCPRLEIINTPPRAPSLAKQLTRRLRARAAEPLPGLPA